MKKGMLCLKLKDDDFIKIGDDIMIQVKRFKRSQISVKVIAPVNKRITRHKIEGLENE